MYHEDENVEPVHSVLDKHILKKYQKKRLDTF